MSTLHQRRLAQRVRLALDTSGNVMPAESSGANYSAELPKAAVQTARVSCFRAESHGMLFYCGKVHMRAKAACRASSQIHNGGELSGTL